MSEPDYILDLGRQGDKPAQDPTPPAKGRPFISIHFDCCKVFTRVYLNAAGTAYVGWCPRCAKKVTARVGPDGTSARIFRAT